VGELLVVTGPPGSGKSTVAARLVERRTPSALVEGDAVFGFLREGRIDPWLPASQAQNEVVTAATGEVAGRFAGGGYWTVFDGIVGPWFLPRFAAYTGLDRLHYVVLLPPVDVCVARVAGRTGHGFTDRAATEHMHRQFDAAASGEHVLRAADGDAAQMAATVMDLVDDGRLWWPA
jgi:predicted kinase